MTDKTNDKSDTKPQEPKTSGKKPNRNEVFARNAREMLTAYFDIMEAPKNSNYVLRGQTPIVED